MSRFLFLIFVLAIYISCQDTSSKGDDWSIKDAKLITKWAEEISPENVWSEYPRPQHQRAEWLSLNGLWDYAIVDGSEKPDNIDQGKILVPFPVESSLSGVNKRVSPDQSLWYKRSFQIPAKWSGGRIILNFGAVDWEMTCRINGQIAGEHKGGYDPFGFEITSLLQDGTNTIEVKVADPTSDGFQPVGKQVLEPGGIFYTAVTGIWQTVWLEPVPETYLADLQLVSDIDASAISIRPNVIGTEEGLELQIEVREDERMVACGSGPASGQVDLAIANSKLWSPEEPNLYDLRLILKKGSTEVDKVSSYFGMRKIHLDQAGDGFTRMFLNNEPYFHNGPLDQGYWPDGLYTPPSDVAMKEEVQMVKELGFNMLRKHVKIEPDRFYYWCDKIGVLVWQDMPNGDEKIGPNDPDIVRTEESANQFEFELTQMIKTHYNHPSIVMWVPFNEGWGQYKTAEVTAFVKNLDPTRLVNNASGWTDRKVGDVYDIHSYPQPAMPEPEKNRAVVLGEFGGIGLTVSGHLWNEEEHWGYEVSSDKEILAMQYEKYYTSVWELQKRGLSAAVYTQLTDVETETNGLLTYDRAISKLDPAFAKKINTNDFIPAPGVDPKGGMIQKGDLIILQTGTGFPIHFTTDGSVPDINSPVYEEPIIATQDMTVSALVNGGSDQSRSVTVAFTVTDMPKPVYKYSFADRYAAGGFYALVDGKTGGDHFADGAWQGIEGEDLDVTIDLAGKKVVNGFSLRFIDAPGHWIFYPSNIEIQYAGEDQDFQTLRNFVPEQSTENKGLTIAKFEAEGPGTEIRYVKIVAENIRQNPEWHSNPGGKTWIFIDEIVVEIDN